MELSVVDLEPFLKWRLAQRSEGELPIQGYSNGHVEQGIVGAVVGSDLGDDELRESCAKVSTCLRETGVLVIRDPRCSTEDNDRFLDMMERYFGQAADLKRQQERPELHYQVQTTFGTPRGATLILAGLISNGLRMTFPIYLFSNLVSEDGLCAGGCDPRRN